MRGELSVSHNLSSFFLASIFSETLTHMVYAIVRHDHLFLGSWLPPNKTSPHVHTHHPSLHAQAEA